MYTDPRMEVILAGRGLSQTFPTPAHATRPVSKTDKSRSIDRPCESISINAKNVQKRIYRAGEEREMSTSCAEYAAAFFDISIWYHANWIPTIGHGTLTAV